MENPRTAPGGPGDTCPTRACSGARTLPRNGCRQGNSRSDPESGAVDPARRYLADTVTRDPPGRGGVGRDEEQGLTREGFCPNLVSVPAGLYFSVAAFRFRGRENKTAFFSSFPVPISSFVTRSLSPSKAR